MVYYKIVSWVCMVKSTVVKIIILGSVIAAGGIIATFYVFRSQKPISPVSSKPQNNESILVSEKHPSKTLKEYADDSGFSFKYPEDLLVTKKESNDSTTYANLELTSNQTKGNILIKITDTKLKSVNDWFKESKLSQSSSEKKEIKIGEISGTQAQVDNNKLLAGALNQDILFTIEVNSQNQKHWLKVYDIILSSFKFVAQKTSDTGAQPLDDSSGSDAVLEEETIE